MGRRISKAQHSRRKSKTVGKKHQAPLAKARTSRRNVVVHNESYSGDSSTTDISIGPHEKYVRIEFKSSDGKGITMLLDVILSSNNRIVGGWPAFGMWDIGRSHNSQKCNPFVLEKDGSLNFGEEDGDWFSSRIREIDLTKGTHVIFRESAENGKILNKAFAFVLTRMAELGRREL